MNTTIDFLGIGAPRAGTTWLWNVLKQHPGIWMPPIKELHYFDRSPDYPSPSILADDRFFARFFGKGGRHELFRRLFVRSIGKALLSPRSWSDLPWLTRYFLGACSDEWYLSLFAGRPGTVKGEITPAYSILDVKDIQRVRALLPGLRLIYLIRNPVERAWSGLRLRWARRTLDINNIDEIIRTIESPSQADRSDYLRTIENWSSCFPRERLLICFFDDIVAHPRQLVEKILAFLNVDPTLSAGEAANRVNAAREMDMPEPVKRHLARKYYPEIKKLIPVVNGYSETWLKEIEALL